MPTETLIDPKLVPYKPERDLAVMWPVLVQRTAESLDRLDRSAYASLLEKIGYSFDGGCTVMTALVSASGLATQPTRRNESVLAILKDSGLFNLPEADRLVVMARLGEAVTSLAIEAYRDALFDETRSHLNVLPGVEDTTTEDR